MHKPEPVQENETQKFLRDFEIQTDPLISDKRSELLLINKKKELFGKWILPFPQTTE